jgi:hypothetical protein
MSSALYLRERAFPFAWAASAAAAAPGKSCSMFYAHSFSNFVGATFAPVVT